VGGDLDVDEPPGVGGGAMVFLLIKLILDSGLPDLVAAFAE